MRRDFFQRLAIYRPDQLLSQLRVQLISSHHQELHSRTCLELVIRYKTSVRHALDTKYELHTMIWQSSHISDHELDDADLIAAVNFHGKRIARHLLNGDLKLYPEVERVA